MKIFICLLKKYTQILQKSKFYFKCSVKYLVSERKVLLLSSRAESRDDNSSFISYASTPLSVTDRVFVQALFNTNYQLTPL